MIPQEFWNLFRAIDRAPDLFDDDALPRLFRDVPLAFFGELLLDIPADLPNLRRRFPTVISPEVQRMWTGTDGAGLFHQSLPFIKDVIGSYQRLTGRAIEDARVLDFGVGWGRLIRLMMKYVPADRLYGVDPSDEAIGFCREQGLTRNILESDFLPAQLPTPADMKFDLVYAFSVFTHLSAAARQTCLDAIRKSISADGLLVATIRLDSYWEVASTQPYWREQISTDELKRRHWADGTAFIGFEHWPTVDGLPVFGDVSFTLDYVRREWRGWRLVGCENNSIDSWQISLLLRPV